MTRYRRHGRTPLGCEVKLEHDELGEVLAVAKDVSETGLFIMCKMLAQNLVVGDALVAKIFRDDAWHAPSLFRVVRLTEDGLGLTYH
ncbi:MAG: PilZ domain-containing protein [Agarilytica sp.]